jgi:hypothetical protein
MTRAELIETFALTGELLTRGETDPTVVELCNVAGRMAFELLRAEQRVASTIEVSEPTQPVHEVLSAAETVGDQPMDVSVSSEQASTCAEPITSTMPKPGKDWAGIKRRWRAKQREIKWSVYVLIDPRDGTVFYVGCSKRPKIRRGNHKGDPGSAAWPRVSDIRAAGLECIMGIVAQFEAKAAAVQYEYDLIAELPRLVNRTRSARPCDFSVGNGKAETTNKAARAAEPEARP